MNRRCNGACRVLWPRGLAFSLVEIVTVIVILSILTLIAVPLIGNVNTSTGEAALRGNIAALRNAIELYANQHNGLYPAAAGDGSNALGTEAAFTAQLTKYSNAAGAVSASKSASYPYGPYLKQGIPSVTAGPLAGNSQVSVTNSGTALSADGSPTSAWKYSYVTGQVICNSSAASSDGVTTYAQF
ncbi:MAG: type II secretion system protein [Phycisphaerales bacterium]|nr:type II secretion system protein [Phycisphaerales bacterium]